MTSQNALLDELKNLLSAQFQELVFRYGLPPHYQRTGEAQSTQAIELIRYAQQQKAMPHLLAVLAEVKQTSAAQLAFTQEVRDCLPSGVSTKPVSPDLSASLRNTHSERLFAEFQQRLQDLPETKRDPYLLNALGKLAMAVGLFDKAEQLFTDSAQQQNNQAKKAEAHYNAYRAALEQQDWQGAQAALLKAAQQDAARFEPFPLRKYQLQKILGAGGFGTAFLCHDTHLDEAVVIKTLHQAALERNVTEIFREARTLKKLNHPALISIEHCDFADDDETRPYLVMAYFDGISLDEYLLKHGALPAEAVQTLALLIAEAMLAAHTQGILHCDLKPANILVARQDQKWQVKLIDFGLALRTQLVRESRVVSHLFTLQGVSAAGTLRFAAPEQFAPRLGKPGTYSDVFGFGKTLCYALFLTANPTRRHWNSLTQTRLAEVLSDCVEEDYRQRLPDFGAVLQALTDRENLAGLKPFRDKLKDGNDAPLMLCLSGGPFNMGSENGDNDEQPIHEVTLRPFAIGAYAVTFEEFDRFIADTHKDKNFFAKLFGAGNGPNDQGWGRGKRPVINVSWQDAVAYCAWLSIQTGETYRLPTEAEWEYACRAGDHGAYSRDNQGNAVTESNLDDYAWYSDNAYKQTHPVGEKQPNQFGLYDMHGNVWEWTCSAYASYTAGQENVCVGNDNDANFRVLRGGSWNNVAYDCRVAGRINNPPDFRSDDNGFRVLRVALRT